jgi:hypothetical protein
MEAYIIRNLYYLDVVGGGDGRFERRGEGARRRAGLYVPGSAQRCTVGPLPLLLNWGGPGGGSLSLPLDFFFKK